jgi:hypothetical protein
MFWEVVMKRFPVPLVAVLCLAFTSFAFGQNAPPGPPGARPGAPAPGAAVPGMPPARDNDARPQTGTARIKGRVVSQAGAPLRRAQIAITLMDRAQLRRVTTTDAEGRYEFQELPAGRFNVTATKAGYVSLQYGQRRPYEAGTPVNIADGQTLERVDFALPRGSVIAVRITDEFGEPIAGAQVQVQRFQYGPDGQRRLTTAQSGISGLNGTDDRGEFRVFGLMPGEYVLMANIRNLIGPAGAGGSPSDTNEGFAATYYPGSTSSTEAQAITVGVGEELSVHFSIDPSRMGRVNGSVVDSEGRPAAGAQLSVVTVSGNGMTSYSAGQVAADGSFTLSGIAPGEHTIRVTQRAGSSGEWASVPVVVGAADITGLQITTGPGATITGRVVYDGTSPRTGLPVAARVTAQQADPQRQLALLGGTTDPLANGTIDEEGNFKLAGVGGRVFLTAPAPPGWAIKSVSVAGDDITDMPIDMAGKTTMSDVEIVLTDKLTDISGQVTDARGQVLNDYVVVIQPAEQKEPIVASRAIRLVRPDTSGRFQTRGMRPGRYIATAIESIEQGRQFAPEFQQQLRRGAREFTVREGEAIAVDLRLTSDL